MCRDISKGAAHGTKEFPVGPVAFILSQFLASYLVKRFACWFFFVFLIVHCVKSFPTAAEITLLPAECYREQLWWLLDLVPTLTRPSTSESLCSLSSAGQAVVTALLHLPEHSLAPREESGSRLVTPRNNHNGHCNTQGREELGQHFQYQIHIYKLCYNFPPVVLLSQD